MPTTCVALAVTPSGGRSGANPTGHFVVFSTTLVTETESTAKIEGQDNLVCLTVQMILLLYIYLVYSVILHVNAAGTGL